MQSQSDRRMDSPVRSGPSAEVLSPMVRPPVTSALDPQLTVELPNEIQQLIFEYAASSDGKCALRLCQISRYVYTWIHPILYQRVVIQDPQSAVSFFKTLRSKPRGYFEPMIRSLAIASTVTLPQARASLVECSRRILLLTLFRKKTSKEKFLDYIKSPYLKRLTMVCFEDAEYNGLPTAQYEIPLGLLASLTHLALVFDYWVGTWPHLSSALLASRYPDNALYATAYSSFQTLTHVALPVYGLDHNMMIRKMAKKLRYLAIVEPRGYTPEEHRQLVVNVKAYERSAEYATAVPRSMVILRDLGDPSVWKVQDSFRPSKFWKKVEKLVDEGYLSDQGEKWGNLWSGYLTFSSEFV
ncbi:hypothetical protein CPB84DRAFT_822906 [Gymnopilus junonius]|uniref:F-box domain-containing protein n=1 Tax=Gymnopilus junonius TaxID=109634 RepID=A0A9P5NN76_GYMJU|nr:hypothetical protein CPB84DRAFT_822906 [Gymnopilus junonius]